MTDNELLGYACEQFLGKSVQEIKSVILQTLEGHLRSILGRDTAQHRFPPLMPGCTQTAFALDFSLTNAL